MPPLGSGASFEGTTYRFYVRGRYFGVAVTRARALAAAKEALESWDFKTMTRKRPPRSEHWWLTGLASEQAVADFKGAVAKLGAA